MSSHSSISQSEMQIDPEVCTAIIYSSDGIGIYTVEIRQHDKSYFIKSGGSPETFQNISHAKAAARRSKAELGYLAVCLTYEDIGTNSEDAVAIKKRYDYQMISLST